MKFYRKNKKLPFEHLTNREREVLKMVAEGNTSREIGDLLYISLRTVEHHRANIMRKMKFRSVADRSAGSPSAEPPFKNILQNNGVTVIAVTQLKSREIAMT